MKYDRVTQVLAPFTGVYTIPKCFLEPAAERGTAIHTLIEGILSGFYCEPEDDKKSYIDAFKEFKSSILDKFIDSCEELIIENRYYSMEMLVTGKMDVILCFKDETLIFDWKTSSKYSRSWELQGAAYEMILEENGFPNAHCTTVHLQKNGKFKTYQTEKKHRSVFTDCLELYRYFDMEKIFKDEI